jgi:hypothetical protein
MMTGIKLSALLATLISILISPTDSWKLKRSNRLSNGMKYVVVDDTTGIQGIPQVWLSNPGVKANLETAASKCQELGLEWEIALMNSTDTWEALSHVIDTTEKPDFDDTKPGKSRESEHFWLGAEVDAQDDLSFVWQKTGSYVRPNVYTLDRYYGEIDGQDKFRADYDPAKNIKYGLIAYIPGCKWEIRYLPTDAGEERRYMCTKTKGIGSTMSTTTPPKPTPYEKHLYRNKVVVTKPKDSQNS